MSEVIDFAARRREMAQDDAQFLVCQECGGDNFSVVCRFASGAPFVAGLLCAGCEYTMEIGVCYGKLMA